MAALALAIAFFLPACSEKPAPPSNILAQVGPRAITVEDFEKELAFRRKMNRQVASRDALLQEMIQHQALLARAEALGLEKDPDVRRNYENMLVGRVKERELEIREKSAEATPEEIKARYQKDLAKYSQPAKARLALLFLKTAPTDRPEKIEAVKAQMNEAREKAQALPAGTAGFGALAINYSEDGTTRYRGGDAGWFDEGEESRWPHAVTAAGLALQNKGDLSEVIATEKGFFLVMKTDVRPANVTPLEQVAEVIRRRLTIEKRQALEKGFLVETQQRVTITTNPKLLETVPFEATTVVAGKKDSAPPAMP